MFRRRFLHLVSDDPQEMAEPLDEDVIDDADDLPAHSIRRSSIAATGSTTASTDCTGCQSSTSSRDANSRARGTKATRCT
jgi:hypothetical protein